MIYYNWQVYNTLLPAWHRTRTKPLSKSLMIQFTKVHINLGVHFIGSEGMRSIANTIIQ